MKEIEVPFFFQRGVIKKVTVLRTRDMEFLSTRDLVVDYILRYLKFDGSEGEDIGAMTEYLMG